MWFDLHFSDSDVEHLFMYLLAIWMSSLKKCVFASSVHFRIRFFFEVELIYNIVLILFPVLHGKSLLFIYFIYSRVYLLIPYS